MESPGGSGLPARRALVTYVHDFESTIQDRVSCEQQLIGILNFSALLHEDVYLNDVAIGDNPYLISSFLQPPHTLYRTVSELIRNGVLFCHLRDKIVIRETDLLKPNPFLSDIYQQWLIDGPPTRFVTQIFDTPRDLYNSSVDDLLNKFSNL